MSRRQPGTNRTDTLFPYRRVFRSRRKGDRTANERAGTTCRVGKVGGGLIEHAVIKGLQANANILRFHDCSSRIPSNDAKEPKWPAPISAWKPDRPSKSFKLRAARITSESRGSRPYITL